MPLSIVEKPAISAAAANLASLRLPQPFARLEKLRQALALSQQDSMDARQQVELLMEANAKLWELAVKREHEVAKVRHFAYHDELTGLPNRTLLADRLNQALIQAKRHDKQLALLFLDLDGFKNILPASTFRSARRRRRCLSSRYHRRAKGTLGRWTLALERRESRGVKGHSVVVRRGYHSVAESWVDVNGRWVFHPRHGAR